MTEAIERERGVFSDPFGWTWRYREEYCGGPACAGPEELEARAAWIVAGRPGFSPRGYVGLCAWIGEYLAAQAGPDAKGGR